MKWSTRFPILESFKTYSSDYLKKDLIAGITVGVLLVPQAMAYAMLADLPPIYGLYAALLPLLVYALLGTSRQLSIGPVAMVSLLIAAGVGELTTADSGQYIPYAILLALMVGLIQLAMGFFRLGFVVNFLSHPVVSGFTSAAALIIGFSQLKHILGVELARSNYIHEIILEAWQRLGDVHLLTLGLGLGSVGLLLFIRKMKWRIPGPLVIVIGGIILVWLATLTNSGIDVVGDVPKGLPLFQRPHLDLEVMKQLLPIALTISFISFMQSTAISKSFQKRHRDYKIDANQELIALGSANIVGSFFQGFPVTGGFSRTAVNDQMGAKSPVSSIVSAGLIVLTLLFLTPVFFFLPNVVLGAIIMVSIFSLIEWKEAKRLWIVDRTDFFLMGITFFGTLLLGIEEGVLMGLTLSIGMLIFRTARPHIAVLGKIPGHSHYRNVNRFDEVETRPDILIFRFDARLYFANLKFFRTQIEELIQSKGPEVKVVIFDAGSVNGIDSSAISELTDLAEELKRDSIRLFFAGLKGPVRDQLEISGFTKMLGSNHFFLRIQDAVDFYDQKSDQRYTNYVLQSN